MCKEAFGYLQTKYQIDHFWDIPMDSQTTDIKHFAVVFHYDVTTKALETQLITYDVIMKNNSKVCDVHSLVCKIKVLNGRVLGTWKWTIL